MSKKGKWTGAAKRSVKRYNAYRRAFQKRTDKMIGRGLTPYDAIPLSYREYKEIYAEERNDRLKEVEKGIRTSVGNINDKIISDQVYELSEEQAYAIFDYIKKMSPEERAGLDFSFRNINEAIAKIRQGEFVSEQLNLWDIVKGTRDSMFDLPAAEQNALLAKYKAKLLEKGKKPTYKNAVAMHISHTLFGSPI